MFFLEIVFWFYIGITVLNYFNKTIDNLLDLALCELGTNPDDETGYFGHMGFPSCCLRIDYLFNKEEASLLNEIGNKKTKNMSMCITTSYPQPYLLGSGWAAGTAMDNSNGGGGKPSSNNRLII